MSKGDRQYFVAWSYGSTAGEGLNSTGTFVSLDIYDAADGDRRRVEVPWSDAPIITGSATLPAGANATLIAHLQADGAPTLGVFVNETTQTAAGEGRLVVRHTAAAPAVDVLAGGEPVITNLENPNEETLNLPAGTVPASVAAAGTTDPVIGPVDVPVVAGQVTIVYAIGSLEEQLEKTSHRQRLPAPGLHAHLGYLHSAAGNVDTARSHFETEKELFPESARFMDYLIALLAQRPAS